MAKLSFVSKALSGATKAIASKVKSAAKTPKSEPSRFSQAAIKRPSAVTPSTPRPSVTPSTPLVSSTSPTRTSSLIIPGAQVAPSRLVTAAVSPRNLRDEATTAAMIAARRSSEEALAASRAADAQARTFGMPQRDITPARQTDDSMSYDLLDERTAKMFRDQELAARQAAATPPPPVTPPAPAAAAELPEEGIAAAATRRSPQRARIAFEATGALAPAAIGAVESQGQEVPGFLKAAAGLAAIASGASLGLRGLGKSNILKSSTRREIAELPTKRAKTAAYTKGAVLPLIGAASAKYGYNTLRPGAPAETPATAFETPVAPSAVEPSYLPPLGGTPEVIGGMTPEEEIRTAIDNALGNLSTGAGTPDDAATVAEGEKALLDTSVADAMAALEAAYGGPEEITTAVAANDPILLQQLAAIDADYQSGLLQIQANYAGALGQVAGYQAQADALMKDVAAQQMAGFAAAAGGLEAMSPGVGLTGPQAAAAGISDTALGGAGITGAALARGLAGASSAQAAADRLRLGTDLSGQLATGRLSQADLEAGLSRAAAGEKALARTESAKRSAEERALAKQQKREDAIRIAELKYQAALDKQAEAIRKEENEAARKQRIAELKMNAELDLAMKVASMTPEQLAAYRRSNAGSAKFTAPSWYGKVYPGDPAKELTIPGYDLEKDGIPTVGSVNIAHDLLDSSLQDPAATDPTTALKYWTEFYFNAPPSVLAIYKATGRPASPSAMYKTLFPGAAPKK